MISAAGPCPLFGCNGSSVIPSSLSLQNPPNRFHHQQHQRQYYQQEEKSQNYHYDSENNDYDNPTSVISSVTASPLIGNDFYSFVNNDQMTTSALPLDDFDIFNGSSSSYNNENGTSASFILVNLWNVFDEQYMRHNLGWTITLVVAYTLILIIGVIGNCMVILVVLFRPQMRTVTNMFIMNLAVADLFVIVFCVPATLFSNIFTPWILGEFMCKGVAYVQGVSVCASAYSLAAISLDRCKAIYRPLERPRGISKSQAVLTICFIWVIALLLTIPWAVIFSVVISERDGLSYCLETWRNEQHGKIYFLVANLICCYSLPLVIISISNVVIWCHVSHRKVPQDSASIGTIKRMHRRTRHGVRKMLGIVTLAFLLSWLPLYVIVTRVKFSTHIGEDESNILDILLPFAQWLGSWNSCINPVLYAFLNSKFRKSFKSLLPSWIPFVSQDNNPRSIMMRSNFARGTVTNGHTGTTGSCTTTLYTPIRGSARSISTNSSSRRFPSSPVRKNFHHGGSIYRNGSSFRDGVLQPTIAEVGTTTTVATNTTTTVSALVAFNGNGGNGNSTFITTTTIAAVNTNAKVTDL